MGSRTVRGIDHVALTVPDIRAAERFLLEGLGAELVYDALDRTMPPYAGPAAERMLGGPPGMQISMIRMYRVANGPGIELFEYSHVEDQRPPHRGCDFGWQHVALYVDDMEAAIERAIGAGAEPLGVPWDLAPPESGPGNRFCFVRAPFGALIEFVTYPSPQDYERNTKLRRWKPLDDPA